MKQTLEEPSGVLGERDAAALKDATSLQSRISSLLAVGLMCVLGLGMLAWYYAHAFTRQNSMRQSAQESSAKRAQGDLPLPSLGKIAAPLNVPRNVAPAEPPPAAIMPNILQEVPLAESPHNTAPQPPAPKTAAELTLERQLSGTVFAAQSSALAVPAGGPAPAGGEALGKAAPQEAGELSSLLRPAVAAAARAEVLATQRLLLPKGAFLDCTLETAIDSTLPGMTTCVMATDTFGVDGAVVLLERGTKLVGETRGQVQQGAARVFVLWNEARTPTGVIVPLSSPGADELGRSGLPGEVERHFWQRFGAAILVSVIDGALQAAVQSRGNSGGAVIVNPSSTQDVMTEVLKGTIGIPPTVVKHQGDRIQVLVAHDLDFRSVYELRAAAP